MIIYDKEKSAKLLLLLEDLIDNNKEVTVTFGKSELMQLHSALECTDIMLGKMKEIDVPENCDAEKIMKLAKNFYRGEVTEINADEVSYCSTIVGDVVKKIEQQYAPVEV